MIKKDALRQQAEANAAQNAVQLPKNLESLSPEATRQLLHELRVHQIELQMQNEELIRAQQALEAARARYFDLYDLAPVGYLALDEQGLINEANMTAATLLDLARNALITKPLTGFIFKEDQDIYYLHCIQLSETGKPQNCELRLVKKDGTAFWAHLVASTVKTVEGTRECRVLLSDVSARRQAEAQREAALIEKNKLQEHLNQAQKMEAVGRLAGGVAHDFNNMLGVILGHVDLALEEMDPALPLFSSLQEIRQAAECSADLTRQLLAFARKQAVVPRVLSLNKSVAGMLRMLRRLIGEDIDLAWLPGEILWPISLDPSQLDQILANLCINARDAIADVGKITIQSGEKICDPAYCSPHPGFLPGEYVWLSVSDSGTGMDPETLLHLFEPFFTTKKLGQGSGLGLATVYGIIKQNKGFIKVISEPGQGTTFTIYLPRYEAQDEPICSDGFVPPTALASEIILLAEDEPALRRLITIMLERLGYTVLVAATPSQALRLAKEQGGEIHLLLSDVVMPEMNGSDLAKQLLDIYPNIKRLFISGYTADIIAHRGVLDEGVHFLQKPFTKNELAKKIRDTLGQT